MKPVVLPANQPPDRFYEGGPRIQAFRGEPARGDRIPEDWIASTTTLAGDDSLGLTTLPNGTRLRDAVVADPQGWLGDDHIAAFGVDTKLLIKLLDAGQRLPVHAHPSTPWAAEHLGLQHGKAEAWYILEAGDVYLGLREDTDAQALLDLVNTQRTAELLGLLHQRSVEAGDTVYVPPGALHAIGAGILLAEIQEPEDLSILLEWHGFELDGEANGHLGLGFPTALTAVTLHASTDAEIDALITRGRTGHSVLSRSSAEFFRADLHEVAGALEIDPGFAILIVTEGSLRLESAAEDGAIELRTGTTTVAPHSAGALTLSGTGNVLVFRPPVVPESPIRPEESR